MLSLSSKEKLRRAAAALEGMNRSLYLIGERGVLDNEIGVTALLLRQIMLMDASAQPANLLVKLA